MLETAPKYWKPAYNLGYSKSYDIIDLAKMVAAIAHEYNHNKVKIEVEKKHIRLISDIDIRCCMRIVNGSSKRIGKQSFDLFWTINSPTFLKGDFYRFKKGKI